MNYARNFFFLFFFNFFKFCFLHRNFFSRTGHYSASHLFICLLPLTTTDSASGVGDISRKYWTEAEDQKETSVMQISTARQIYKRPFFVRNSNFSQSELDLTLTKLNKSKIGKNNASVTDLWTYWPSDKRTDRHILIDLN